MAERAPYNCLLAETFHKTDVTVSYTHLEIIQKGLRMIGQGMHGFVGNDDVHFDDLDKELSRPTELRIFSIAQAMEEGRCV